MPKFRVEFNEVWRRALIVEAESEDGARQIVEDGNYSDDEEQSFTYGYLIKDDIMIEVTE